MADLIRYAVRIEPVAAEITLSAKTKDFRERWRDVK